MNAITQTKPDDNALILERLRRKSPHKPPSASEVTVASKMLELIQRGSIGLEFNDPDDCDANWSDAAVFELIAVMLSVDRKFLINEVLEEMVSLHYPMQKLMEQHPEYWAKVEAWEVENDIKRPVDPMTARKDYIEDDLCTSVSRYKLPMLRQG